MNKVWASVLFKTSVLFPQLDPSIYESLQKERVEVGDVIYIEANSGAVKVSYYYYYITYSYLSQFLMSRFINETPQIKILDFVLG